PAVRPFPPQFESVHRPTGRVYQHWFLSIEAGWLVISREQNVSAGVHSAALNAVRDGIVVTDASGRCLEVNESFCKATGLERSSLLGTNLLDLVPADRHADVQSLPGMPADTSLEIPLLVTGSRILDAEWRCRLAAPGNERVYVCNDVARSQQQAERLRRTEEALRLAHEAARIGSWYLDRVHPARNYWSAEMYEISGIDASWSPNYDEWIERLHPDDRVATNERITAAFQPGAEGFRVAYRVMGDDGQERWQEARGRVTRDRDGNPVGATGIALDIGPAKRAEQELRAAHSQLRAVVENSPLPVVMLTRSGEVTLWNPAAERLFGWTRDEVIGNPLPFIPEEKRDEHLAMRDSDLEGQTFHNRLIRRKRRDGSPVDLTVSTALLEDSNNQICGILSIYADVTEHENVRRQLADAAERLTLTLEASGMGDWMWDAASDVVTLSRRAAEIFEVQPGPYVPWAPLGELLHPDDAERAFNEVKRSLTERKSCSLEFRVRSREQSWRWVLAKGRGIYGATDTALKGMLGVVQDITARRDSEAVLLRLHTREQQARQTAELLNRVGPAMLAELDSAKLAQQAIDLATQLTGAEHGVFSWSREPGADRETAVFGAAPASPMSTLSVPVVSRSGAVLGTLQFTHREEGRFAPRHSRIAAGIAAQAAIAIENARLFAETQRSAEALERINEELRRTNDDLEHFAWSASHDLQEPLRQVATFSQLLKRRYAGHIDATADQFLDYVVQGAKRMEALVRDILAYTHVSRSALHDEGPVEANAVVQSLLSGMEQTIVEADATIEAEPLPVLKVRDIHLERLFQNLLSNALKYRSEARPLIRISAQPAAAPGYWQFAFADNGLGIDPRYHKQIFALFRRLHSAAQYDGTGIGLAICQKIVERYGGEIWVESSPGQGATFHFTLPGASVSSTP
ncbi:MAG TPA: PAS domain S-box protein, partial [Bryobacteraceae bacterium]|nr:PAS domain S-box protein [Bryobacteraceae bacterium]